MKYVIATHDPDTRTTHIGRIHYSYGTACHMVALWNRKGKLKYRAIPVEIVPGFVDRKEDSIARCVRRKNWTGVRTEVTL